MPSGVLGSDRKHNTAKPVLVGMRIVALSIRSHEQIQSIEDIYFFEVNTKYISLSVLKTSESSRVRSTSENSNVFNS